MGVPGGWLQSMVQRAIVGNVGHRSTHVTSGQGAGHRRAAPVNGGKQYDDVKTNHFRCMEEGCIHCISIVCRINGTNIARTCG